MCPSSIIRSSFRRLGPLAISPLSSVFRLLQRNGRFSSVLKNPPPLTTSAAPAATSHSFLISAHLIRYDIFVAALAYGSLAICIVGCRRRRSALLFIAGVMIAVAFEVHVNAAIFAPIIITILVAQCGWGILGTRQFGAFAFAVLIGLATYFWMHVAQYPTTFFAVGKAFAMTHLSHGRLMRGFPD